MAFRTAAGQRLAWLPLMLAALIGSVALGLEWMDPTAGTAADPVSVALILVYGFVGGLIIRREPRNAVGWLLGAFSVIMTVAFADGRYVIAAFGDRVGLPGGHIAAAFAWLWQAGLACPVFVAFLVPTGRPGSRLWAGVLAAVVALFVVVVILFAIGPPTASVVGPGVGSIPNPFYIPSVRPLYEFVQSAFVIYLGVFATGAVALLVRFHGSRGTERQQLKWILAGIVAMIAGIAASNALPDLLGQAAFAAAMVPLPASISVAILRFRLYDIDRIISRGVSYGLVTAALGLTFATAILVLEAVLAPVMAGQGLAVAGSTLLVAALFQPLAQGVQRVVDRRFDRARYDAEREVELFTAGLRDQTDLGMIARELLHVVDDTIAPRTAHVWLREDAT